MKKIFQFTLCAAVIATMFTFQGCSKISSIVKIPDVSFTGASTDITLPPTNDTTAQAAIGEQQLAYNIDSMIKAQSSGLASFSSIKAIKISSITLTLLDGNSSNNFANFSYAGATFNTSANNGNYDPYTIAYVENNPDVYALTLTPPVTSADQDVKKYFSSNMTFYYIMIAKLRRPITTTLHCHVDITYDISF